MTPEARLQPLDALLPVQCSIFAGHQASHANLSPQLLPNLDILCQAFRIAQRRCVDGRQGSAVEQFLDWHLDLFAVDRVLSGEQTTGQHTGI